MRVTRMRCVNIQFVVKLFLIALCQPRLHCFGFTMIPENSDVEQTTATKNTKTNTNIFLEKTTEDYLKEADLQASTRPGVKDNLGVPDDKTSKARNTLIDFMYSVENSIEGEISGTLRDEIRTNACDFLDSTICFECDNVKSRCHSYGTCCSNHTSAGTETQENYRNFQNWNYVPRLICEETGDHKYLIIRSCPLNFSQIETRNLCEEEVPVGEITMETISVVTADTNGVNYFNKFCALCNGVHSVSPWPVSLDCHTYVYVIAATNSLELMRLAKRKKESTCTITQTPSTNAARCHPNGPKFYREKDVISSCNVTTLEKNSLPRIEKECVDQPTDITQRIVSFDTTFKNVYCLLCNAKLIEMRPPILFLPIPIPPPAFTFLFGFHNDARERHSTFDDITTCKDYEWQDPKGKCHNVICSAGKTLQDNQCVTAMDQIRGLPYRLTFWLLPPSNSTRARSKVENYYTLNELKQLLDTASYTIDSFVFGLLYEPGNIPNPDATETQSSEIPIRDYNNVTGMSDAHKDENIGANDDPYLLKRFSYLAWFEINLQSDWSLSRDMFESVIFEIFSNKSVYIERIDKVLVPQVVSENISLSDIRENCYNSQTCVILDSEYSFTFNNVYLEWHQALVCPYIEISEDQVKRIFSYYSLSISLLTSVQVSFDDVVIEFSGPSDLNQILKFREKDRTFYIICRDLLESKTKGVYMPEDGLNVLVLYVLNNVVVLVSIVCLSVTVITYCLFPSLRCVAGCNTLGLSFSFLAAQVVTLAVSSIDYGTTSAPVCISLGIVTHYAWLSVMTWSFLCCLHMLQVFTTNVRSVTRDEKTEMRGKLRNLTLSLCLPCQAVVAVVVTSFLMHGGIGYGDWRCLFNDVWAMYVPLLLVTICNVIFFTIVVIKIWRVRQLQANADFRTEDRKYFFVYIKLSTVTGMFWLLTMMAEIFDNDFLRYVSTVINGGQGVFIFCSFILNRRVLNLYARHYKCLSFLERSNTSLVLAQGSNSIKTLAVSRFKTADARSQTFEENKNTN